MSILPMVIMASKARFAMARSGFLKAESVSGCDRQKTTRAIYCRVKITGGPQGALVPSFQDTPSSLKWSASMKV